MNRRQKKKQFKRRFGFNPPRSISIKAATYIMERRKNIITAFEKIKKAILNLWEAVKKSAFISNKEKHRRQYEALQVFQTKVIAQQRQQESEVMQIESDINISNHDRR